MSKYILTRYKVTLKGMEMLVDSYDSPTWVLGGLRNDGFSFGFPFTPPQKEYLESSWPFQNGTPKINSPDLFLVFLSFC